MTGRPVAASMWETSTRPRTRFRIGTLVEEADGEIAGRDCEDAKEHKELRGSFKKREERMIMEMSPQTTHTTHRES
jgi:hypothetical protein